MHALYIKLIELVKVNQQEDDSHILLNMLEPKSAFICIQDKERGNSCPVYQREKLQDVHAF